MKEIKKPRILIVDDEIKNLKLMAAILKNYGYSYETAKNGFEALEKTKEFSPDLIFLDIMMPEMGGFETCRRLKKDLTTQHIPVVMVTALADRESRIKGLKIGANDFITKPIDSSEVMVRAQNLIKVKEYEDFLKLHNELLEKEVKRRTKMIEVALRKLKESKEGLKESYIETIHRLTVVAEYKDVETASHIRRIGHYCKLIGGELGWSEDKQETIGITTPLHDIGKIGIPAEILLKQAKLSHEEFSLMKTHTVIGASILKGATSEFLQVAEKVALTHHEKFDGSGYPYGLKEEEIAIEGRIAIIADQYDSLRSSRPYKPSFDHETVFKIITEGNGRTTPEHFDPRILEIFKDCNKLFEKIYEEEKS